MLLTVIGGRGAGFAACPGIAVVPLRARAPRRHYTGRSGFYCRVSLARILTAIEEARLIFQTVLSFLLVLPIYALVRHFK